MSLDHPWPVPPAPGDVITVAPGIKWLRMPLPFQLDHINLWLLADGPAWTVVDTGVGLPDTRALWERVFAGHLDGRPIARVLVTHFHPDHMGNGAWLTERWGADLWCTQAEWLWACLAFRTRDPREFEPRLDHYPRNGCDQDGLAPRPAPPAAPTPRASRPRWPRSTTRSRRATRSRSAAGAGGCSRSAATPP